MKVPYFNGKGYLEAYLEQVKKRELIFDWHNYSELKEVKRAHSEFIFYAIDWWDHLYIDMRRIEDGPIETWIEMKSTIYIYSC